MRADYPNAILPESTFKIRWRMLRLILVIYYALVTPFRASFWNFVPGGGHWAWLALDWAVDVMFLVDMFLRARRFVVIDHNSSGTPYMADPSLLMRRYLKGSFWLDIIAAAPLELLCFTLWPGASSNGIGSQLQLVYLLRLNKLVRLIRIVHHFQTAEVLMWKSLINRMKNKESRSNNNSSWWPIFQIFKVLFFICLFLHMVSCGWYLCALIEDADGSVTSWIENDVTNDNTITTAYLRSFYWALLTISSVGYGGVVPITYSEYIFTVFYINIGPVMYLAVLAVLTLTVDNINLSSHRYERSMQRLAQFCITNQATPDLRAHIFSYFQYQWFLNKDVGEQELHVLRSIPRHLRAELMLSLIGSHLVHVRLFTGSDKGFLSALVVKMMPLLVGPDDECIRAGEIVQHLYICHSGEIDAMIPDTQVAHKNYTSGNVFMEVALLRVTVSKLSFVARSFTHLFTLSKEDFDDVLPCYPSMSKTVRKHRKNPKYEEEETEKEEVDEEATFRQLYREPSMSRFKAPSLKREQSRSRIADSRRQDASFRILRASKGDTLFGKKLTKQTSQRMLGRSRTSIKRASTMNPHTSDIAARVLSTSATFIEDFRADEAIISPTSAFRMYWDLISGAFLMYYAFGLPVRVSFGICPLDTVLATKFASMASQCSESGLGLALGIECASELFFMVDIFLRLGRFAEPGDTSLNDFLIDRETIRMRYLKTLWADVLGSLPIGTIHGIMLLMYINDPSSVSTKVLSILSMLRFLRLIRLHRFSDYQRHVEDMIQARNVRVNTGLLKILAYFLGLLIVSHVLACAWFLTAQWQDSPNSWIYTNSSPLVGQPANTASRYMQSTYFIYVTLATVGYGDIKPRTAWETGLSILVMFTGAVVYSGVTATIASIASNMDLTSDNHSNRLDRIRAFLKKNRVDQALNARVLEYHNLLWVRSRGMEDDATLGIMPQPLLLRVGDFLHQKVMRNSTLFKDIPETITSRLASLLRHMTVLKGSYIYNQGQVTKDMLVISRGVLEVTTGVMDTEVLMTVEGPLIMNEECLLGFDPHEHGLRARSSAEIWTLSSIDFERVVNLDDELKAKLAQRVAIISAENKVRKTEATSKYLLKAQSDADVDKSAQEQGPRVIQARSLFRVRWELLGLFATVTALFVWPFLLSFFIDSNDIASDFWTIIGLSYFVHAFFAVDLILRVRRFVPVPHELKINVPVSSLGTPLMTPADVTRNYFAQSWAIPRFCMQLLPCIPLELFYIFALGGTTSMNPQVTALLKSPMLLLAFRVPSYVENMEYYLDQGVGSGIAFSVRQIFKLSGVIVLTLHWMSCWWHFVGSTGSTTSWYNHIAAMQTPIHKWERYLYSMYWALQTVTTTGYGDVSATNIQEEFFTILVIVFGDIVYGGIIGSIACHTSNLNTPLHMFQEDMQRLKKYFEYRNLPRDVRVETSKYYHHLAKIKGGGDSQGDGDVMKELPPHLRRDIAGFLYYEYLYQVPVFRDLDEGFLSMVCSVLKPRVFLKGDQLVRIGDIGDAMYFLQSGRILVFIYNTRRGVLEIRRKVSLEAPAHFGETAIVSHSLRTATVRALSNCVTLSLLKDDFESLFDQYPNYREAVMQRWNEIVRAKYTDIRAVNHGVGADPQQRAGAGIKKYISRKFSTEYVGNGGIPGVNTEDDQVDRKMSFGLGSTHIILSAFMKAANKGSFRSLKRTLSSKISKSFRRGKGMPIVSETNTDHPTVFPGSPRSQRPSQFIAPNPAQKFVTESEVLEVISRGSFVGVKPGTALEHQSPRDVIRVL